MKRFYEVVKNSGVGLTFASMGMSSFSDCPAVGSNLTPVGEIRLVPDLSTKHRLPWYVYNFISFSNNHLGNSPHTRID